MDEGEKNRDGVEKKNRIEREKSAPDNNKRRKEREKGDEKRKRRRIRNKIERDRNHSDEFLSKGRMGPPDDRKKIERR